MLMAFNFYGKIDSCCSRLSVNISGYAIVHQSFLPNNVHVGAVHKTILPLNYRRNNCPIRAFSFLVAYYFSFIFVDVV